ncbi:DUF4838 domain-containing protein [Paenibacillus eucommiae]|uniref:DUF4838 domain-containing protein n=1 Tax=Paenibacillus eucommiae TaxID=1355755 RepID=A0ABS4J6R3_9BACL|nr:DUF4838 domain-containing protein [Paenibacillus eucommiae]MBP1995525.1 hypothetical protein [Paenibacillus eucommiae]
MSLEEKHCKIIENKIAAAVVIVADESDAKTKEAAELLASYVFKATGAVLPVLSVSEAQSSIHTEEITRIFIGAAVHEIADEWDSLLAGMDVDGFIIQVQDKVVAIKGPSPWGTEFGVYEFLERYVGVRWLMPGEFGEAIPQLNELILPLEVVKQEPVFLSRSFSGSDEVWDQRNRLRHRFQLGHNLWQLFSPKKYASTHPQFFPKGVNLDIETDWQPCFTAPGLAQEAVKSINAYFDEHPDQWCYSICTNDNGGFDEARPDHPLNPHRKNSVGEHHMSEIFFKWAVEVANGVKQKHPDKYLSVYAYSDLYDPPETITLPSNIIVYITDDRMSWEDKPIGQIGHDLTMRWHEVAPSLGFYEYAYGSPYTVPRVYLHRAAENYRYAQQNGVLGHYAELYANWGEGPKPWVLARLQWNPQQSVDALIDDWCEAAVGKLAGGILAQYYKHWEHFWLKTSLQSSWYKHYIEAPHRYNYMPFYNASYLYDVTEEDIAHSRHLLESVLEKSETEVQRQRAQLLIQAFTFYEASALSYPRRQALEAPTDAAVMLQLLDENLQRVAHYAQRIQLVKDFHGHPVLHQWITPESWNVTWIPLNFKALSLIVDWLDNHGANQGASNALEQRISSAQQHAHLAVRQMGSLLHEAFIAKSGRPDATLALRTHAGMSSGGELAAEPGTYGMLCRFYVPEHIAPSDWILLQMLFQDAAGNELDHANTVLIPLWAYAGETIIIPHLAEVPQQINGQNVDSVKISVHFKDCKPEEMSPELIGFYKLSSIKDSSHN